MDSVVDHAQIVKALIGAMHNATDYKFASNMNSQIWFWTFHG